MQQLLHKGAQEKEGRGGGSSKMEVNGARHNSHTPITLQLCPPWVRPRITEAEPESRPETESKGMQIRQKVNK